MGHPGKHIIDPETGLCELCDDGAIREVHRGKRPGKQIVYTNSAEQPTYRANNDEIHYKKDRYVQEVDDEPTPRIVHKPVYSGQTVRPRRTVYAQPVEEPIYVRKKIIRRDHTPPDDVIIHHPLPLRQKPFQYVDKEGQVIRPSRNQPAGLPRRYAVRNTPSPPPPPPPQPVRTVHVVRKQVRTPSPPVTEPWHNGPPRQINSDTEIIERERIQPNNTYYSPLPPIKPEMYFIDANPNHPVPVPSDSPTDVPYENNTPPPPKVIYPKNGNRKQNRVEPIERKAHNQGDPTVVRRVYKKSPLNQAEPYDGEYIPNESPPRTVRKAGKSVSPQKSYRSSPELTNRNNRSPQPLENPTVYYIRATDDYK